MRQPVVAVGLDPALHRQQLGRLGQRADRARADRGERRGPEHRRVGARGLDRRPDRIGLELEHQRLVGEPAVDPQAVDVDALADRLDDVGDPPGDPLERRARDLSARSCRR